MLKSKEPLVTLRRTIIASFYQASQPLAYFAAQQATRLFDNTKDRHG
jgi:hypothetical protein